MVWLRGANVAFGERFFVLLHRFKTDWRLTALLLAFNALGIGYGYYYYFQVGQFDPSSSYFRSPWLWLLIPDSPNAVLLMSLSLILFRFGKRSKWLDALAFTQMIYVGLWTTALFLLYPERMGTFAWSEWPQNANPLLFVSHMGMPLEALVLVHGMRNDRFTATTAGALVAFSAFFVMVDYWGPVLHPAPFMHPNDAALHAVSPWLMIVTLLAWFGLVRPIKDRVVSGTPQLA